MNRHIPSCYICNKMFVLVHLLSVGIFDICFQWDSKLKNMHLFLHSIDNFWFLCGHKEVGGTVPPLGRVWDWMSAYIRNWSISINPVIYFIRLLCLQVYVFGVCVTLQLFKIWFVVSCLLACNSVPVCKHFFSKSLHHENI